MPRKTQWAVAGPGSIAARTLPTGNGRIGIICQGIGLVDDHHQ